MFLTRWDKKQKDHGQYPLDIPSDLTQRSWTGWCPSLDFRMALSFIHSFIHSFIADII